MAVRCWASVLDGCGEQSREHYTTAGLWEGPAITTQGFSWCLEEPRIIGVGSATAKILCRPHNSALSPIDKAAISAFHTLREVQRIQNIRARRPRAVWRRLYYDMDGILLERWFVKTAIDLLCVGSAAGVEWLGGTPPLEPPKRLVHVAFGIEPAGEHLGVYALTNSKHPIESRDVVKFAPLLKDGRYAVAALFEFRGLRFLVSLVDEPVPVPRTFLRAVGEEGWSDVDLKRRPGSMEFTIGTRVMQVVRVAW